MAKTASWWTKMYGKEEVAAPFFARLRASMAAGGAAKEAATKAAVSGVGVTKDVPVGLGAFFKQEWKQTSSLNKAVVYAIIVDALLRRAARAGGQVMEAKQQTEHLKRLQELATPEDAYYRAMLGSSKSDEEMARMALLQYLGGGQPRQLAPGEKLIE